MSPEVHELNEFDWFGHKGPTEPIFKPTIYSIMQLKDPSAETQHDRQMRMLRQLSLTCTTCSMCELGRSEVTRNSVSRDPHVFSNTNPSQFFLVGYNPGWSELGKGSPLAGENKKALETALQTFGFSLADFYITNAIKCYADDVTSEHATMCKPFLDMELNLLKPTLVVTLGKPAFNILCPDQTFEKSVCRIAKSERHNKVPVFPIYHPASLTTDSTSEFYKQIKLLCGLMQRMKDDH